MGTTPNVGLMAQKAEEYGSHDKTFEIAANGRVRVVDSAGNTLIEHEVEAGDIWRACQTKDAPVRDWVRLAVERARATGAPAVFWLDRTRAHDVEILKKVETYLADHDTDGLQIEILPVGEATRFTLERAKRGEDTISVTGNVLRDYLTDLFPILELGTSAKMLSIVPLMNGGGLFETGAGGSAPKHVQQLVKENHLRWDSLGEFLALAVSFEFLAEKTDNPRAARAREDARRGDRAAAGERQVAAAQGPRARQPRQPLLPRAVLGAGAGQRSSTTPSWRTRSSRWPSASPADEEAIVGELDEVQGESVDLGGYYFVDRDKADAVMRPSETFNAAIDGRWAAWRRSRRMGERTSYPPGTFSWAELATSDADAAKAFYTSVFGWDYRDSPLPDGSVYSMATRDGGDVAALYETSEQPPHWNCYVTVASADESAARAGGARRDRRRRAVRRDGRRPDGGDHRPGRRGAVPVGGALEHRRDAGEHARAR